MSLDTGACVYGGVTRWWLAPGRLRLTLSKEASDALGLDTELSIEFDAQHAAELEEWLPKVLATG